MLGALLDLENSLLLSSNTTGTANMINSMAS